MHNLLGSGVLIVACFALTACGQLPAVRGKEVPTAMFVFYDRDSAALQAESEPVVKEAAAFLTQYDNTAVKVVGHYAGDEHPGVGEDTLDNLRAKDVADRLTGLGARPERITTMAVGLGESLAGASEAADDDIDRRVDLLFGLTR